MAVANHPRQLPAICGAFPDLQEFEGAAVVLTVFDVAESVLAGLDGAEVFYRVDLHAAGDQLPLQLEVAGEQFAGGFMVLLVVLQTDMS